MHNKTIQRTHQRRAPLMVAVIRKRYSKKRTLPFFHKIELVFLPPYAPNLNLIEWFWKFFKKTVLYGRYYETFCQFKTACDNFFAGLDQHRASLRLLLTDRFQSIGHA